MIEVDDQSGVLEQVANALLHDAFPSSQAVVVPPGFGEALLSTALVEKLRGQGQLVAHIAVDQVRRPLEYVRELQRQWSIGERPQGDVSPAIALQGIVATLSKGRPALQIITRFDKFLDVLDHTLLGAMRALEANKQLRSAVFTPWPYEHVKRRWMDKGKKLVTSNYGDTHDEQVVRPMDPSNALETCARLGIQRYVARFLVEQSGAFPDVLEALIRCWGRGDRSFDSSARRELAALARDRIKRFVELSDMPDQSMYRSAMASMYYDREREEAVATLRVHPWGSSILDGDELRAEALGTAASMLREPDGTCFDTARSLYSGGRYREALDVLRRSGETNPSSLLLEKHAQAMALLVDLEGEQGIDTDWAALRRVLAGALKLVSDAGGTIGPESLGRVRERHEAILASVTAICGAVKTGRRIVDSLSDVDPRSAFWLVYLAAKRARTISRNSAATQAALPLPEQVFRLWARWTMKLDYHAQPDDPATWERVHKLWAATVAPEPGKPFPSFNAFAWFAMVRAEQAGVPAGARPERGYRELEVSLGVLQIRRDQAHALARCNDRERELFFELVSRWMTALLAPCDGHPEQWAFGEFEEMARPLPLLAADGELEWM
jgi:hypothetical protein